VLDSLLERIYKGEKPTYDRKLLRATAKDYVEALQRGYGNDLTGLEWDSPDFATLEKLTENVYHFSAAKNYHELKDLSMAVRDGNRIRSFEEFQKEAEAIIGKYNHNWLRAEYNQAVAAAQAGARWNDYKSRSDAMPYLQYQCVMDGNTRPEHAALHGVIKRIDDPFWDKYYPPNGWGCRCEAVQLPGSSYKETPDSEIHPPVVVPMFQMNFGKQGVAFPEGHAYFRRLPEGFAKEAKEMAREEVRRVIANAEQYMTLKDNPEYKDVAFDWTSGGVKGAHIEHNFDKKGGEYEKSVQNAGFKAGHSVILEKEIHTVFKKRNTEGFWDEKPFEVAGKETATANNIRDGLKHCAKKPRCKIAILYFPKGNFDEKTFIDGLNKFNGLKNDPNQWTRFEKIICIQNNTIIYEKSHI